LIGKLQIGTLDAGPPKDKPVTSYLPTQMTKDGFAMPAPRPSKAAVVAAAATSILAQSDESDQEDYL
jgi:hypothetical protein